MHRTTQLLDKTTPSNHEGEYGVGINLVLSHGYDVHRSTHLFDKTTAFPATIRESIGRYPSLAMEMMHTGPLC